MKSGGRSFARFDGRRMIVPEHTIEYLSEDDRPAFGYCLESISCLLDQARCAGENGIRVCTDEKLKSS